MKELSCSNCPHTIVLISNLLTNEGGILIRVISGLYVQGDETAHGDPPYEFLTIVPLDGEGKKLVKADQLWFHRLHEPGLEVQEAS